MKATFPLLILLGCAEASGDELALVAREPVLELAVADVGPALEPEPRAPAPAAFDPYADWRSWCEGPADPCRTSADCGPDRTGRARKCIRPFWSEKEKVCAIPHPRRSERDLVAEDVRRIVDAQCGRRCTEDTLYRFVSVVAARESSWRPWKHHRLNPDIVAARTSWGRARARYEANPHYPQRARWQGWGMLGQQSATFTAMWDAKAPPEVLCRPTVAIATYLSCARRSWVKQRSLGVPTTWESLHSSCSLGKVIPKGPSEDFRRRAARAGLDPTASVDRLDELGQPMGPSPAARNLHRLAIELVLEGDEGA